MKTDIHPEYDLVTVHCSCGNEFQTRSTADKMNVELCSECHPFYTGKQKLVDTGGRIDRFERRYGRRKKAGAPAETAAVEGPAAPDPEVTERLEEVEAEQAAAAAKADAEDASNDAAGDAPES